MQTDINYPSALPAAQWAKNSYSTVSPLVRTTMASGRAKQRRGFSSVPVMRRATWKMNGGQGQLFEKWYEETLKDGTEWFNVFLRHPMGYRAYVCRFTDIYDGPEAWGADEWLYSATLEVFDRPLIPSEWLLLPGFVARSDIFDIAMNQKWTKA